MDINELFMRCVGRHFVTISCMQTPAGCVEETPIVVSGFVVEIENRWFYITAGHVLLNFQSAISSGAKFDVWRFGVESARGEHSEIGIPFDFVVDDWLILEDSNIGLDYAAYPIPDLCRQAMEKGNVQPIRENAWGDHVTSCDQWVLVGAPNERVRHDGDSIMYASVLSIAVEKVKAPTGAGKRTENQFYARLIDGSEEFVTNVQGMSGGPIFMTTKTNAGPKYKLIGVQSAWYESARIIAACPFVPFAESIKAVIRHAETSTIDHEAEEQP